MQTKSLITQKYSYLNNGDAQERASEADGSGRGGHDGGAEEEANCHGDGRDLVSAGDDLGLHGHEEPWAGSKRIIAGYDSHQHVRVTGWEDMEVRNTPYLS